MLATPAFGAPWDRTPASSDDTTIVGDARQLRGGQDGATVMIPPRDAPSPTPKPRVAPARSGPPGWVIGAVILAVVLAGIGLALALGSSPPPTTTSTTTPPSTTTTLPSISHSLATMVNDVVAGQSSHGIGPQTAQSISSGAQQAVTDLDSGNAAQAATDLQGVASDIATGLANNYMTPAYGTLLQNDLKTLADALGLSAAATPSSTTTTSSTTPGPPDGNGNGKGHGNGNGN